MKILLTGDKGFVGRNIGAALRADGHTIGIEAEPQFSEWYSKFHRSKHYYVARRDIDAVDVVKVGIYNAPAGTFNLNGEYWCNEDLAALTDWKGYQCRTHSRLAMCLVGTKWWRWGISLGSRM